MDYNFKSSCRKKQSTTEYAYTVKRDRRLIWNSGFMVKEIGPLVKKLSFRVMSAGQGRVVTISF